MTDVCLCEYTDHGHCGLLDGHEVDNDPSLERLAATAVSHARRRRQHRRALGHDGRAASLRSGQHSTPRASGRSRSSPTPRNTRAPTTDPSGTPPESTPEFGDRRGYQMDPPNRREALREMRLDLEEGADMLMVKPAMAYLDVLADARRSFDVPARRLSRVG